MKLAQAYGRMADSELRAALNQGDLLWSHPMKRQAKCKSDAFEAIHSAAQGLLRAGTIGKATMRELDESCLAVLSVIARSRSSGFVKARLSVNRYSRAI